MKIWHSLLAEALGFNVNVKFLIGLKTFLKKDKMKFNRKIL